MRDRFEAQRALQTTLLDIHRDLALAALQKAGVEVSVWPDVAERLAEIHDTIAAIATYDQQWQLSQVCYDDAGTNGKTYSVPMLDHNKISLIESGTPTKIFGKHYPPEDLRVTEGELNEVIHPVKFLDLNLHPPNGEQQKATVFIGPDMPPVAVHGEELERVEELHSPFGHWMEGLEAVDAVEKTVGEEAVERLSDEACVALAGALRIAKAELGGLTISTWGTNHRIFHCAHSCGRAIMAFLDIFRSNHGDQEREVHRKLSDDKCIRNTLTAR